MKKWTKITVAVLALLLSACGNQELPVLETIGGEAYEPQEKPVAAKMQLKIPEDAVYAAAADGSGGELYTWEDHTLMLQTLEGGDFRKTVETITGLNREDLTVMTWKKDGLTYHQTVWSTAGEDGTLLGRALIADDGYYHYCISLLSPEESDSQQVYDSLCASFALTNGDASK